MGFRGNRGKRGLTGVKGEKGETETIEKCSGDLTAQFYQEEEDKMFNGRRKESKVLLLGRDFGESEIKSKVHIY